MPPSVPEPPPFSFTVDDVFYIKPPHDKVILTGAINEGTIRVGDALVVQCASGDVPVILVGIETLDRGQVNEASGGQQVGLDLRGIREDQPTRGDRVVRNATLTSDVQSLPQPWATLGWLLLGVFAFALGAFLFLLMEPVVLVWWYADRYEEAELQVVLVRQIASGRLKGAMTIEGVLHPSGEAVVVSGHAVLPYQDGMPFGLPAPAEIEGQRLPVLFWPRAAGEERWWQSPRIVRHGATQRSGVVVGAILSWVGFGSLAAYCFRRVYRHHRSHQSAVAYPPNPHKAFPGK